MTKTDLVDERLVAIAKAEVYRRVAAHLRACREGKYSYAILPEYFEALADDIDPEMRVSMDIIDRTISEPEIEALRMGSHGHDR